MDIVISTAIDRDNYQRQAMMINGQLRLRIVPLNEYPEDAIIERDLVSCDEVVDLMIEAYNAGKNGEDLNIVANTDKVE